MAEAESIASTVGVAALGYRLSLFLNAVACNVANSDVDIPPISNSVTMFSWMLKQAGSVLQSADSVHSDDAVDAVKAIAEEGKLVFDEIQDMLERASKRRSDSIDSPTVQQRFKWCFKKHRVHYLLAQLESSKLNLSVILQILQLGKLMASTSKSDPPERVAQNRDTIRQERAEAQNILIVSCWQMHDLDRSFENLQQEEQNERLAIANGDQNALTPVSSNDSLVVVNQVPPDYEPTRALVKLRVYSLGELDQAIQKIRQSPKDMIQVSNDAIDPLLNQLTRWHEIREERHKRDSGGRFVPSVQNLYEDDDERPLHERYPERENSPRGVYLEGPTTDWRKPNSGAARQEAYRRRKQYSSYQASVSPASSDVEHSSGSKTSKKRSPRHHIIDSNSESSDSDGMNGKEVVSERRQKGMQSANIPRQRGAETSAPTNPYIPMQTNTRLTTGMENDARQRRSVSPQYPRTGRRPHDTPEQPFHHSLPNPLPPINTANAPNPYGPGASYSPHLPFQPQYVPQYAGPPRYIPSQPPMNRMPGPPRPGSRDGIPGRSPARIPSHLNARPSTKGEEAKSSKSKAKENLRDGATKGLLGTGAIAGFLEVLEGLSL